MIKLEKNIIEALKFYKKNDESATKVSEKFKVDRHTLTKYDKKVSNIEDLVYHDNYYYILDDKELAAINDFIYTEINFLNIRKKYGYKQETFKKKLEVFGYPSDRKYKLNYDRTKFEKIETEEDAYMLGLILADGYIHERSFMLRIKLQEKDKDMMFKICDYFRMDYSCIKFEIHTQTGNKAYYVPVYCKQIIENLKKLGLFQAKSNKEIPYYGIDKRLQKHYIRGIFDGDGFINQGLNQLGFCGSKEVLEYICSILKSETNLDDRTEKIFQETNVHKLKFTKQAESYEVAKYMYENSSIYLNRKMNLYSGMVNKHRRVKTGQNR